MGHVTEDDIVSHNDPMMAELIARSRHMMEEATRLTAEDLKPDGAVQREDEQEVRAFVYGGTALLNVAHLPAAAAALGLGSLLAIVLSDAGDDLYFAAIKAFEDQFSTTLDEIARRKGVIAKATRQ